MVASAGGGGGFGMVLSPLLFLQLLLAGTPPRGAAELTDGNSEHLKREHSLIKPYQGASERAGKGCHLAAPFAVALAFFNAVAWFEKGTAFLLTPLYGVGYVFLSLREGNQSPGDSGGK